MDKQTEELLSKCMVDKGAYLIISGRHIHKSDYPPFTTTFDEFKDKMNSCLTKPFNNEAKLYELFYFYKLSYYSTVTEWIKDNGIETVEEWTEFYFRDWDYDKHNTILKSTHKAKHETDEQRV